MDVTQRQSLHLATEIEIQSAIADIQAALKVGPRLPNIWGFFSNKNRQLLTLLGDVTFIQAVLLEGDQNVRSYIIAHPPSTEAEQYRFGRDLLVQFNDGSLQWNFCGRYEYLISAPTQAQKKRIEVTQQLAADTGAEFCIRTERHFAGRMIEFWNCLMLSSAMTRSRDFSIERETSELLDHFGRNQTISIGTLLATNNCDPALMLAAIARAIVNGYVHCDLALTPIDAKTLLSRANSERRRVPTHPNIPAIAIPRVRTTLVPRNRRTVRIPEAWQDLEEWPCPQADLLQYPEVYRNNKRAIEMFIADRDFATIERETGVKKDWLRQLFNKCLAIHSDGRIVGFRALVKYGRDSRSSYHRHIPPPPSNLHKGGTGGYAGTFVQLFERFPEELLQIVEANVLKLKTVLGSKSTIHDQRVTWKDLQSEVLTFLKKKHIREDEYPFNTRDKCYTSLATLGRSILFKKPIRFIASRFGQAAADFAHVGKGISSLIQATRPYQVVELDFHKFDSASIVDVTTPNGFMLPCHVPRCWIGCVVDTYNRAIIGSSDSFEPQTTESCVLDLIDAAVAPPHPSESLRNFKGCEDGNWLPNQLLPGFEFHGWDILRLDRAIAHRGKNTLSGLIATLGCAVCFGKPRAWWARSIVERSFNELTRRSMQRLPTTYGTGVNDNRRRNPEQMAMKLHFTQEEMCDLAKSVIREINDTRREGVFWESSLNSLLRTAAMPNFIRYPLPQARRSDRPIQWIRLRRKIEANVVKGISPSVRFSGCRYHGTRLAKAWNLVGQFAVLEIDRHDIRNARLICEQTGTIIDSVVPDSKWRQHQVSWRNFQMIQKFGRYSVDDSRPEDPVRDFKEKKGFALEEAARKGRTQRQKKTAQQLANLVRDAVAEEKIGSEDKVNPKGKPVETMPESKQNENRLSQGSFGLTPPPSIRSFSRR